MGVLLYTKGKNSEKSITVGGYGDFFRLRYLIAEVYDKQKGLGGELSNLYKKQLNGVGPGNTKEFWDTYNAKLDTLEKERRLSSRVLDFLYQSDCDGKLTPDGCRMIWKIMSDYKTCRDVFATKGYGDKLPEFGYSFMPYDWNDIAEFFKDAWLNKKIIYWC